MWGCFGFGFKNFLPLFWDFDLGFGSGWVDFGDG